MPSGQRKFSRSNRWFVAAIFSALALILFLVAVSTLTARAWVATGFVGLMLAASIAGALRVARAAVIVDGSGVTVRNIYSTRKLTWNEVKSVRLASEDPFHYVRIVLNDESTVKCQALAPTAMGGTAALDILGTDLKEAVRYFRPNHSVAN